MDYVCALVPRFLASLARRDNAALQDRPVIIGRSSEARGTVVEASVEAGRAGVVPGMQITRALVLCPSAAVVALREDQFVAAGREFLAILADHSPAVEEVEPGHLHADVRGLAKLAGLQPQEYVAQLQQTLAGQVRLPVQAGGAGTVFVAHAAAAYLAKPAIAIEASKAEGLLALLPVDVLPVSAEMLRRLGLFGIERLEQLGALPPTALQAQFSREGLLAWRLIHGEEAGRVTAARDELRVIERMELPAPAVISTPMVLATEILFQRGLRRPEIGGRSLRRADWVAELENEERMPLRLVYQEPTSDLARMLFVARNAIERLELPAPAVAIELTLSGICSEYARQERLWRTGPRGQEALGEAVEQLNTRTGAPQIYRVVEVEPWSRIPERQRALAAYYP